MRLEPVSAVPTYELVLEQLRRSIHLSHFGPGDKLPPERELARQLGVSRTTVREAVRVLEGEGIVEIRRGATGGIIVRPYAPPPAELRRRQREFDDTLDFRLAVETATARLAATRRTKTDMRAVDRAFAKLDAIAADASTAVPVSEWLRADNEYHLLIARVARNPRLQRAVEDARASLFTPVGAVWGHLYARAHQGHTELTDAIRDGDADRAAAAMAAHIEATRADIRSVIATAQRAGG
jgi:GntR family transcriptional regulator, transcriptional repressor for pyruvate dehydrogenase complex